MIRTRGKVWLALGALLAALALAGCGGQPPAQTSQQAPKATEPAKPAGISPEEIAKFWENSTKDNSFLMSADDLKKALDAGEDIFILDVRKAEDYDKQGHIPGAVNIPYDQVGKNLDKLPKNKKIAVVCYTGHWAGNTSAVLRVLGFNSYNVRFGMSGWNQNNNNLLPKDKTPTYPTVTGKDPGAWKKQ